ncbi:Uncharacterised protein [Klebsiella oxytoca]|nr:Uncharacterised protein [Klebsiella oxytoca]
MVDFSSTTFHHGFNQVLVCGARRQWSNFTVLTKNQRPGQRHHKLFQLFVSVKKPVFGQGVPHDIDVLHDALLVLVAGFVLHLAHLPADRTALTRRRPVGKDIALAGNVLADFLLRHLGAGEQTTHNALCGLARTEVHAVNVAGHLLQEVFGSFDFGYRGLQGKVKEVARGVGHDLFAEALQLLAVNEAE